MVSFRITTDNSIARVRDSLGMIRNNLKTEGKITPKNVAQAVRKSIRRVIDTNSYQGRSARKGPYRRRTGKGISQSLAILKVGTNAVAITPIGYPEVYAIPLEEGHNSPINGPVTGKGYFRKGVQQAKPDVDREIKKAAKRIMRT